MGKLDNETINSLLGIRESFELPERLMQIFREGQQEEIFEKFLAIEHDLSYDWFTDYFQEENSNRKKMMQDFTPVQVSRLLARLAGNRKTVADICSGTGGLSISLWNENKDAHFYCEELSKRAFPMLLFNLAIRRMVAIAVNKDVLSGETYAAYRICGGKVTELAEAPEIPEVELVVSNPPYSVKYRFGEDDTRFEGYGMPPSNFADYAFVLHGLQMLKDGGKMFFILPMGVLFRGGRETEIRRGLVEKGLVKTVIGLPEKLFLNTGIPVCIICFEKTPQEGIFFINAESGFRKEGKRNILLVEHVDRICGACSSRLKNEKYARLVPYSEIKANGFNLNISRYVYTYEEKEVRDLGEIMHEIAELEVDIRDTEQELLRMMKQLVTADAGEGRKLKKGIREMEAALNGGYVQTRLDLRTLENRRCGKS